MKKVYGDCFASRSNDFVWHKRFLDGIDAEDVPRSGRPISCRVPKIIEKVRNFVANDRCVPLRMMVDSLNIHKGTIRTTLHEDLGKTKVYAKFVSRTLYPEQKATRSTHCKKHHFSH
ncbi:protein GVQW3 [Trichonephila clavipes]|nr:protein GVQW3 [Trichonephila clavipes]